jgi:hypothetical protein
MNRPRSPNKLPDDIEIVAGPPDRINDNRPFLVLHAHPFAKAALATHDAHLNGASGIHMARQGDSAISVSAFSSAAMRRSLCALM